MDDTTAREAHARDFRVFFLRDGTATAAGPEFRVSCHMCGSVAA